VGHCCQKNFKGNSGTSKAACNVLAYLKIGDLMDAINGGEVHRRGNTFTIHETPISFYIRVVLYAVMSFIGC